MNEVVKKTLEDCYNECYKSPVLRGKALKFMTKPVLYRVDEETVNNRAEYVYKMVTEKRHIPFCKQYSNVRGMTYGFAPVDSKTFTEISKTEWLYATYLCMYEGGI